MRYYILQAAKEECLSDEIKEQEEIDTEFARMERINVIAQNGNDRNSTMKKIPYKRNEVEKRGPVK